MIDLNKYSKNELSMLQTQIKYELQKRRKEEHTEIEEAIHKFHTAYNNLIALVGKSCVMYKSDYAPCNNGGVIYINNWNDFVFDYEKEENYD